VSGRAHKISTTHLDREPLGAAWLVQMQDAVMVEWTGLSAITLLLSAPTWQQNAVGGRGPVSINAYQYAAILHAQPEHLVSIAKSQMSALHAHMVLAQKIKGAPPVTHAQTGIRATLNVARKHASGQALASQVKDV